MEKLKIFFLGNSLVMKKRKLIVLQWVIGDGAAGDDQDGGEQDGINFLDFADISLKCQCPVTGF